MLSLIIVFAVMLFSSLAQASDLERLTKDGLAF
jgi:hypothetical protein